MPHTEMIARLRAARVVPVVRTNSTAHARTVVGWLRDAGITVFEITMTIPDAPALIAELSADPALLVGAGTVPDAASAQICLAAGARFIVAPWVDPSLAAPCRAAGAALLLGAITPTEVRAALAAGSDVVKIFPPVRPVDPPISRRSRACSPAWRSAPPEASRPRMSRPI
jgi:2-dehydro-3-deoxyphosphogluconate aldolase / (4S)-4-hydroxy-2-oxoglutarate aldolase